MYWKSAVFWYVMSRRNVLPPFSTSWRWRQQIFLKRVLFLRREGTGWGGGMAARLRNLVTRWRWAASITPWPLYPRERLQYPLNSSWAGPVIGMNALKKKKSLATAGKRCDVSVVHAMTCIVTSRWLCTKLHGATSCSHRSEQLRAFVLKSFILCTSPGFVIYWKFLRCCNCRRK
jgi:hypothetical protein